MGKKILAFDDATTLPQPLGMKRHDAGYVIIEAREGIDALTRPEKERGHVLITEFTTPHLAGVGLIVALAVTKTAARALGMHDNLYRGGQRLR